MSASAELILRRLILALLTLGLVVTLGDLLGLGHYKDSWQVIPIASLITALLIVVWHVFSGSAASVRVLRVVMAVFLVVGLIGLTLHMRGSVEFQLEANPDLAGWPLIAKVLKAKAPPALAPGAMVQMGLLGLVYAFRHPAVRK
jgi:hypothetical protein